MPFQDGPAQSASPFRPRFQYSLWSMFVLMTAAAVGLAFFSSAPIWLMILVSVLLALALPMVLTIAVIYGRGRLRTFSIGALFPAGFLAVSIAPMTGYPSYYLVFELAPRSDDAIARLVVVAVVGLAALLTGGFGLLALWVRRMVERLDRGPSPSPARPTDLPTELPPAPFQSELTSD